jgi:23S rRNA pseudouridine1911/1915/1917 synthase
VATPRRRPKPDPKPQPTDAPARGDAARGEPSRSEPLRTEPTPGGLIAPGGKVDPGAVWRAANVKGRGADATPDEPPAEDHLYGADVDDEEIESLAEGQAATLPKVGEPTVVTFQPQRDLDKRLDKYLCDRITFLSRSKLQALIDEGAVTINGRKAKASSPVHANDVITVRVPAPPSEDFEPQDIPLDVLFEDEHLIVLNKPAGLIVHPARTHTHGTMINALAFHFRNRSATGGSLSTVGSQFARPGVVHRLDRFTSGCIAFAKSDTAHWQLARQFMDRTVNKRYLALALGHVEPPMDRIDDPIGPHPSRQRGYREKHVVRHDHLGKPALTLYHTLARFGPSPGAATEKARRAPRKAGGKDQLAPPPPPPPPPLATLLEVDLKTGRTHQIRVHFSHRGYPLLGDDMYGGPAVTLRDRTSFARQALHAGYLAFRHPISGTPMEFRAPPPADLAALLDTLRAGGVEKPAEAPAGLLGGALSAWLA